VTIKSVTTGASSSASSSAGTTPVPNVPGLDGARAIAVLAVLAYHLDFTWAGGGFLGVEVFFVLSGFLITQLLAAQVEERGRIDLGHFAMARARRLLPALVACVLGTVIGYRLLAPSDAPGLRTDALASLLYLQNWHLALAGIPYGEAFSHPSPFLHLWSLAVEGQLYLFWALVSAGVFARMLAAPRGTTRCGTTRRGTTRRRAAAVALTLVLAVVSSVLMAIRYSPDGGGLVYYATDARASGFLVGAALALAWRPASWAVPLSRTSGVLLDSAGVCSLLVLLYQFATVSEFDGALYQDGGFLFTGLVAAVVIASATRAGGVVPALLSRRVLVAIGRRSYGIYLYHWPLFAALQIRHSSPWWQAALAVAATCGITEVSYRWLETPIRRGRIGTAVRRLRLDQGTLSSMSLLTAAVVGVLVLVCTVPATIRPAPVAAAPTPVAATPAPARGSVTAQSAAPAANLTPDTTTATAAPPGSTPNSPLPGSTPNSPRPESVPSTAAAPHLVLSRPALIVGDSIVIGSTDALRAALGPNITIQAEVGRQFYSAPGIVAGWTGTHDGPVIIDLGANGTVESRDVDAVIANAGSRRVVLVGVAVPRRWQDGDNAVLRDAATRHAPHVVFVDWAAIVEDHPGILGPDSVHPGPTGRTLLAEAIAGAVGS